MKIRIERLEIEVPDLIGSILDFKTSEGEAMDRDDAARRQSIIDAVLFILSKFIKVDDLFPTGTKTQETSATQPWATETPGGAEPQDG